MWVQRHETIDTSLKLPEAVRMTLEETKTFIDRET